MTVPFDAKELTMKSIMWFMQTKAGMYGYTKQPAFVRMCVGKA